MMPRLPALTTLAIGVALIVYWIAGFVAAERKLDAIGELASPRGNYEIALDFAPERFHQLLLQERGRLVEVRGNTVYMMDVTPSALHDIARRYWVDSIRRWNGK
jgi:hypothetical protein